MKKREREWGEDRVLPLLTHIEQRLQHQSAIAPAFAERSPISNAAAATAGATLCGNAQWQQPHLSNTVSTL